MRTLGRESLRREQHPGPRQLQGALVRCVLPGKAAATLTAGVEDSEISVRGPTWVYPKVSGLAAWGENSKWYSSLPLDAVVSLFCESV
jgi:hypothetical protein